MGEKKKKESKNKKENASKMFACCGRPSKSKTESFGSDQDKISSSSPVTETRESSVNCGIGIAFKPDARGALVVKRIISGGSADLSGKVKVTIFSLNAADESLSYRDGK